MEKQIIIIAVIALVVFNIVLTFLMGRFIAKRLKLIEKRLYAQLNEIKQPTNAKIMVSNTIPDKIAEKPVAEEKVVKSNEDNELLHDENVAGNTIELEIPGLIKKETPKKITTFYSNGSNQGVFLKDNLSETETSYIYIIKLNKNNKWEFNVNADSQVRRRILTNITTYLTDNECEFKGYISRDISTFTTIPGSILKPDKDNNFKIDKKIIVTVG
jgi:hypothetical protein